MAVLFSAVTVTAGDQEKEFLVRGIPRELPVISAIGRRILALNEQYQIIKGSDDR